MPPQEKPESFMEKVKGVSMLMLFFARIFSLPLEMTLREDVGERYQGFAGACSFVLLVIFPLLFQRSNPFPVYLLLFLFIIRCIVHRVVTLRRLWRHEKMRHTRRAGTPYLVRLLPNWPITRVLWLEPALVSALGMIVVWFNLPLGLFLILASLGLAARLIVREVYMINQLMDMNDAAFEQEYKAERFREFQGRQ